MPSFTIPGEMPTFNEYSGTERGKAGKYRANSVKRQWTTEAGLRAMMLPPIKTRVMVHFHWYRANRRSDPDNIRFAAKFILDGLQQAGVLANDGWKQIAGFTDSFEVDKANPRTVIELAEAE